MHPTGGRRGRAALPLAIAAAILAALWAGPLPGLSRVSFTAHMALHLGLIALAAPIAALGLGRVLSAFRPPGGWPPWAGFAAALELAVVWGWHVPRMHTAAALVPSVFALQQASFLAAGIAVWLPALAGGGRTGAAAGVIALGASFMHMSMLGMLLATAPGALYPDGFCGGAFGLDPLADQRLGGVMMAMLGGAPYLAGAIFFAHRLLTAAPGRERSERG